MPDNTGIPSPLRKVGPEGTVWCSTCKDFLPEDKFYKDFKRWNGFSSLCKVHHCELTNARKKAIRKVSSS